MESAEYGGNQWTIEFGGKASDELTEEYKFERYVPEKWEKMSLK